MSDPIDKTRVDNIRAQYKDVVSFPAKSISFLLDQIDTMEKEQREGQLNVRHTDSDVVDLRKKVTTMTVGLNQISSYCGMVQDPQQEILTIIQLCNNTILEVAKK